MAISYVGAASAASTSVSLPTFQPGDIAIVSAINFASSTQPSVPAGWTQISNWGASYAIGSRAGYRILQAGDTTTGTWTGANSVGVSVWRGVHPILPFDGTPGASAPQGNYYGWTIGTPSSTSTAKAVTLASSSTVISQLVTDATTTNGTGNFATTTLTNRGGTTLFGVASKAGSLVDETYALGTSVNWHTLSVGLRPDSDFPIIADQDTTSGTVTSNSSSWTLTYPTNIVEGDLLLALIAQDGGGGSPTIGTWPSGWIAASVDNSAVSIISAKKLATGSETGTFTWNPIGGASEQGSWIVYRVPAGTWTGNIGTTFGNGPETSSVCFLGGASAGATGSPDPSSLDPNNWASENTLWIAAMAADTSRTVSAYPSSPDTFTNTGSLVSGGSGGATLAWARLEKNASSVDPGTFTISASDDWATATIAIRPKQVIQKVGQAQAYISTGGVTTRTAYSQAQAGIKTSYLSYAQSSAQIKAAYASYAQANAQISSPAKVYAQALAAIDGYRYARDTFTQPTLIDELIDGIALDDGGIWEAEVFNYQLIESIPTYTAFAPTVGYGSPAYAFARDTKYYLINGTVQVDFYYPTQQNSTGSLDYYLILRSNENNSPTFWINGVYVNLNVDISTNSVNSKIILYPSATELDIKEDVTSLTKDTWYTFSATIIDSTVYYKVWQRGTSEPEANLNGSGTSLGLYYVTYPATYSVGNAGFGIEDHTDDSFANNIHFDNFRAETLPTLFRFGQAQAQISTGIATYTGYAQAQAAIQTSYLSYAQSQAHITTIYAAYAQASVWVKITSTGYAQAQAQIIVTTQVYAQTQAGIKQSYAGYAQANATIKSTNKQYAQASVWIKQTYPLGGGSTTIGQDTFTDSNKLLTAHTPEIGTSWTERFQYTNDTHQVSWRIVANISELSGVDLSIEEDSGSAASLAATMGDGYVQGNLGGFSTQSYLILRQPTNNSDTFYAVTVDTLWRFTDSVTTSLGSIGGAGSYLRLQATGTNPTYLKVERRATLGELGTGWLLETSDNTAINQASSGYVGIFGWGVEGTASTVHAAVDNFLAVSSGGGVIGPTFAQVQAKILATSTKYAQAQAVIKSTYQGYGQANVAIKTTYQVYGQAEAKIFGAVTTSTVYAQSQANIKQIYPSYAQAQTSIKQTYAAYAQANVWIGQTYLAYAQAQAQILTLNLVYAQAQAQIQTTYKGYGQAQTDIKQTYIVYGQAQAHIKAAYSAYGQAQATISQTCIVYAQALALIYIPVYARPIADITTNNWVRVVI